MSDSIHPQGSTRFYPDILAVAAVAFGVAAAVLFSYTGLWQNLAGAVLMMLFAVARIARERMLEKAGEVTQASIMLDRWTAYIGFFFIYVSLGLRLAPQPMPGTLTPWGGSIWVLCAAAAFLCHSPQARLRYYYRQVHHWWSEGRELPASHSMEKHTPAFQQLRESLTQRYGSPLQMPEEQRRQLLNGSLHLQRPARLLSFEVRALVLSVACIAGVPWVYLLFEIIVLCLVYVYMHKSHEALCTKVYRQIMQSPQDENIV